MSKETDKARQMLLLHPNDTPMNIAQRLRAHGVILEDISADPDLSPYQADMAAALADIARALIWK